jgi:eukaryotic-like serine/threonine-protein kinase
MIANSAAIGTMFGPYRLNAKLGRGGMADVYLAEDTNDQRLVALRIVEVRDDGDSREMLEAERRGAELQERFCAIDTHVPRVYAHGELEGCFYVAMEFVDGEDLSEILARGPLRPDLAAEVATQICECLANAHAFTVELDGSTMVTIVHGDITPKNVRVNSQGDVKLLDFGIAKALSLTRKLTRNAFGSFPYLSPERLDTADVDAHADLWSVGVVFYEMLSGVRPYRAENTRKLEKLILAKEPPPALPDTCPEALRRVVAKLLNPDPARRYRSAGAIRSDLIAWKQGRQTEAEREWIAELTADEVTRRTRTSVEAVPDESTRRTARPDASPPPGAATPPVPRLRPSRWTRFKTIARRAAWLIGIAIALNEISVSRRMDDLGRRVVAANADELGDAYTEYQKLADSSVLRLGLGRLRSRLKSQLVGEAERVIADFRREMPTVGKPQWEAAQTWLARALTLEPSDTLVQASLRYAEGQINRLNGEERLKRKARQAANDSLSQAVQRFEEAATLNPRWPDPYLGLVRVYVADLEDLDRALEALRQAERRGYRSGNREAAQFGDAYRARGDRFRRDASGMAGLPQEKDYLSRSIESYQRALEMYGRAPGFAGVVDNVKLTQQRLTAVQAQLDSMSETADPAFLFGRPPAGPPSWP